jgi:hypothetical protein
MRRTELTAAAPVSAALVLLALAFSPNVVVDLVYCGSEDLEEARI